MPSHQKIHSLTLELSWKLLKLISTLDRFDAAWAAIERREGNSLKQLKSIATVRSVGASTRIEGSKMSDDEVAVLIEKMDISKLEERDQQEVAGYFEVLDLITSSFKDIDISESSIKALHNMLLQHSTKDQWQRGNYKQHSNVVEATRPDGSKQVVFQTTAPGMATDDAMRSMIDWYNQDQETLPIIKCALFCYEFVSIHPFQDGNGRLSRLLATLLLLKNGYVWIQYVSLEHEIESRKNEYYGELMNAQRNRPGENITNWLHFFLDCLMNITSQLLLKLETTGSKTEMSVKQKQVYSFIQNYPNSRSGEIAEKLDLNLATVKKILQTMVAEKLIIKSGVGRAITYAVL